MIAFDAPTSYRVQYCRTCGRQMGPYLSNDAFYGQTPTHICVPTYPQIIYYSNPNPHPPPEPDEEPLQSRLARVRLWCLEAQKKQLAALLGPVSPESPKERYGFTRERLRLPVRRRFKKRVCGGSSRYRVLVN